MLNIQTRKKGSEVCLKFEYLLFEFVCDLVLVIWNLQLIVNIIVCLSTKINLPFVTEGEKWYN
jgi:hypothetical protein